MATKTVVPVVEVSKQVEASKLEEVKVTIETGKEIAAILYSSTDKVINLAFELQDSYENQSQFRRDALHDASVMFLKAQCQRSIAQWDNLVSKMTKVQKYQAMTRQQIEEQLKIHPKFAPFYKVAQRAAQIKNTLK